MRPCASLLKKIERMDFDEAQVDAKAGRARQARDRARRSQRAGEGRQGERRHAARAAAARPQGAGAPRRPRHRHLAFRPSQGRARSRVLAAAGAGQARASCSGAPVAFVADCVGAEPSAPSPRWLPAISPCSRTCASTRARRRTIREFAAKLAALGDIFVNDAFSAAHRAHASTEGVTHLLPSYAGPLMMEEIDALRAVLEKPERPTAAVDRRRQGVDQDPDAQAPRRQGRQADHRRRHGQYVPAGARRRHRQVAGRARFHDDAREIMAAAKARGCEIVLPHRRGRRARVQGRRCRTRVVRIARRAEPTPMILDVGPKSVAHKSAGAGGVQARCCGTARWAPSRSRRSARARLRWRARRRALTKAGKLTRSPAAAIRSRP